ncbi:hypothetical protein ACFSTA_20560 [Ornithinibacillus salinisoli]|uniref:Anti-sigma factor RsgI-like middle domain-containing protein n=1 Tax=Ornithinibacillus salinisoli TaxID=1848459 RepID=A0ABW4W4L9_9BACI
MKKHTIEGIVTKVTETEYVLLCKDGTFKNILRTEDDMPMIGERRTYSTKVNTIPIKLVSTIGMVAILFIAFLSNSMIQDQSETHYIAAIDINPSIEAHLDQNLNVLELSPLNTDGKQIVDTINFDDLDFYQVVELIVSESIANDYLTVEEKGRIETSIVKVANDTDPDIDNELKEVLQTQLERHNIVADVQVFNETKKLYEEAEHENISMNKYRHFQALREKGIVQDIQEVKEKSVKQLQEMNSEEDKKRSPADEVEHGKSVGEDHEPNSESKQDHTRSESNKKTNQPNKKPSIQDKEEPPNDKAIKEKDRKNKSNQKKPTPKNETKPITTPKKDNRPDEESGNDKDEKEEKEEQKKPEANNRQSNDTNPGKSETGMENKSKPEEKEENKEESATEKETPTGEENMQSRDENAKENPPSRDQSKP